jgi:hypothetical protein
MAGGGTMNLGQTVKIKAHLVRQPIGWFDPEHDSEGERNQVVRIRKEKNEVGIICGKRKVLLSRRVIAVPDLGISGDLGVYETDSFHSEVADQKFADVVIVASNLYTLRYVLLDDVIERVGEQNG